MGLVHTTTLLTQVSKLLYLLLIAPSFRVFLPASSPFGNKMLACLSLCLGAATPPQQQATVAPPEVVPAATAVPYSAVQPAPVADLPVQAPAPTAVPYEQPPAPVAAPVGALDGSAPVSVDDMLTDGQQSQVAVLPKSAEPDAPTVAQAPTWESRGLEPPTIPAPAAAVVPAGMPDGKGGIAGPAPEASPAPVYSNPSQWEGDYWNFEGRGDTNCVSVSPSTPDEWCTVTCGTNPTGCPDNLCKCGEDAIREAEEIKQAARDNWNEAEQRIRGVKAGQSYPDGLPPSEQEVPGVHKIDAPAPLATQCKGKEPYVGGAMDVWCAKNCARGPTSCSMIQCECEGGIPGATQAEEEQARARAVGKAGPPEAHEEAMKAASDEAKRSAGARALDDPP